MKYILNQSILKAVGTYLSIGLVYLSVGGRLLTLKFTHFTSESCFTQCKSPTAFAVQINALFKMSHPANAWN